MKKVFYKLNDYNDNGDESDNIKEYYDSTNADDDIDGFSDFLKMKTTDANKKLLKKKVNCKKSTKKANI